MFAKTFPKYLKFRLKKYQYTDDVSRNKKNHKVRNVKINISLLPKNQNIKKNTIRKITTRVLNTNYKMLNY